MERFCPVSPRSSCRGSGVAVSSIRGFFPGVALGHKGGGWRGKGHGDSQVKWGRELGRVVHGLKKVLQTTHDIGSGLRQSRAPESRALVG